MTSLLERLFIFSCLSTILFFPTVVHADIAQTGLDELSYVYAWSHQTLGNQIEGVLSSVDMEYRSDTTYYANSSWLYLEECSTGDYDDCLIVGESNVHSTGNGYLGVTERATTTFSFLEPMQLNVCKYYRIRVVVVGNGQMKFYGSLNGDSYPYGAFTSNTTDNFPTSISDMVDIGFVARGINRIEETPFCVDPVIIVPGLLGSFEKNGVLLMDPILHAYDDLIATLEANGYVASSTLFTFPYNWRNSNVDTAILLKQKIDEIKGICNCSKVDIVAHSMGGLVTRQYVQSDTYEYDVDQVIFLATPHLGAPESYLAWEGGRVPLGVRSLILLRILEQEGEHGGFESVYEYIRGGPVTSLNQILPISSYKFLVDDDISTTTLEIYPANYQTNQFLQSLFNTAGNMSRVSYVNFVSSSTEAINSILVRPTYYTNGIWEHGEPLNLVPGLGLVMAEGDGTVPISSASALGNNTYVDSDHTGIVRDVNGDVFEILSDRTPTTISMDLTHTDAPFLLFLMFSPADMTIVSPDGKRVGYSPAGEINEIPGAFYTGANTENEFIVIPNPLDGDYKVETLGTGDGEYTVAVSSVSGDTIVDTEYTGTTRVGDISRLVLNTDTSSPSPTLAIALEPLPVVAETLDAVIPPAVARSGGGGGRRSIQKSVPASSEITTSTSLNAVNPDTFMVTLDIPVERFISLVTNSTSGYIKEPIKIASQKPQTITGVNATQVASVIGAVDNQTVKSVFADKIKSVFTTMLNWFKE